MRWFAALVLVVLAVVPGQALAADCGLPGVTGQYDVFATNDFIANQGGTTIPGRVAAGRDANVQSITLGTSPPLTADAGRADLVVRRNLTVGGGGGSVPFGRVTYGGSLTANGTLTALGGLVHDDPTFDFPTQADLLRGSSAQLAGLSANGTISGPTYDTSFAGSSTTRNVFSLSASQLQGIGQVSFHVPASSTVVVNVTGAFKSQTYGIALNGLPPEQLIWNFTLATTVAVNSWSGTILAPDAAVTLSNGTFNGAVAAHDVTISSLGFNHHPFSGCLPAPPKNDLALESLCTDPLTNNHSLRLRNTGDEAHGVHWEDRDSAQEGDFKAPAKTDTFFDVRDGDEVHHIVVTAPGVSTVEATTGTNECRGTITVGKVVMGEGMPPAGPWVIAIDGANSFSTTRALVAGAQASVKVPGTFQPGTVPIGQIAGGYVYTISEPDPLGGLASVDRPLVTITDGESEQVTVTNEFGPTPPEPPEPPVPPQPPLPPGPPEPLPGPDLVQAESLAGGADLAVTEQITPRRTVVGGVVAVTVRARNNGPPTARAAVAREIPQADPRHPNQVARVLNVTPTVRATSICTSKRPVRCGPATVPPGTEVVIRVRARLLRPGAYKSVVVVSSETPDPNTTNNAAAAGLVVRRPAKVAVAVRAPATAGVGVPVSYRVVARGAGTDGADSVRFCHRPPAGLLVTSAAGTFRYRGQVCRDVRRLARGQQASFVVRAIPAASAGGRMLRLRATATAPDAQTARASDRMAVIAQSFAGTGRG
jgi:choice-of-anchor A domain-containing protein